MKVIDKVLPFIKKGSILLDEAETDLKHGCLNKVASTYYFATESYANAIFLIKMQKTRGFRSRLSIIKKYFWYRYR